MTATLSGSLRPRYLGRIGLDAAWRKPTLEYLATLQTAHMIAVAFENLDVFHRRGVTTDAVSNVVKIVERGRGGWCFELNGAFGWLLNEVGFHVDYVSCRVFGADAWGPPLDHCALVVQLDSRRWLVDVGFGDNCMVPIPLEDGTHHGIPRPVRCQLDGDGFILAERQLDGVWVDQLWGSFDPLPLSAFTPRSEFLQTEPGLPWTERPFATRATDADGSRVTLRPGVLRRRVGCAEFVDTPVLNEDWPAVLFDNFGLVDNLGSAD
jgi:N-hydroxyarylamine O-acetyltransferase